RPRRGHRARSARVPAARPWRVPVAIRTATVGASAGRGQATPGKSPPVLPRGARRPPAAAGSVPVLADDPAFFRIQAQFDITAGRIAGLGLPYAVVELDVVHVAVAGGGQPGL